MINLLRSAMAMDNGFYNIHIEELPEIRTDRFPIGSNFEGIVDIYTNRAVQL